jgi:hypothetical protein
LKGYTRLVTAQRRSRGPITSGQARALQHQRCLVMSPRATLPALADHQRADFKDGVPGSLFSI